MSKYLVINVTKILKGSDITLSQYCCVVSCHFTLCLTCIPFLPQAAVFVIHLTKEFPSNFCVFYLVNIYYNLSKTILRLFLGKAVVDT